MILTHTEGNKEVIPFPKRITLKVNVIAQLEFELVYFRTAV